MKNLGRHEFVLPTGDPLGTGVATGNRYTVASVKRINNGSDKPHDIGCALLATDVPTSVVASYPQVFTGKLKAIWDTGLFFQRPSYIAGFGYHTPNPKWPNEEPYHPWLPSDGSRRWGELNTPKPYRDACDSEVFEGQCFDDYLWNAKGNSNPEFQRGDSGGPLVFTTGWNGETHDTVIAGVASGWWEDQTVSTVQRVWASTGAPGGKDNGAWIINECLGGDADNDGVTDDVDNCPPSRCIAMGRNIADCANPGQEDDDGDGVGEACDNCAQAVCDALEAAYGHVPPRVSCSNPSQSNRDGDSRGDACDLCPNNTAGAHALASVVEPDADGDGVGDACDACDAYNPYSWCAENNACGTSGGLCLIEPGAVLGHCVTAKDSDGDGVPDGCDECPGLQTQSRLNSNLLAEEREKLGHPEVQHLADECDPVPIVRMSQPGPFGTIPAGSNGGLTPGDGEGPDDVAEIYQNGWLGLDLTNPAAVVTVQRGITYRHCSCKDPLGDEVGFEYCTSRLSNICFPKDVSDTAKWRVVTLTRNNGASYTGGTGTTSPRSFTTSTVSSNGQVPRNVLWKWREDVLTGDVDHFGTCPGSNVLDCRTNGVILSRTEKQAPYASLREQNYALGDVVASVRTPAVTQELVRPSINCPAPCKPHWVRPDYLRDPDLWGFTGRFSIPRPLVLGADNSILAVTGRGSGIDVTSYFRDGEPENLLAPDVQWLTAVEPLSVVRAHKPPAYYSNVHAALLRRHFDGIAPMALSMAHHGIGLAEGVYVPNLVGRMTTSGQPPELDGVSGAFSALESSVYMVGGATSDGDAAGTIWRWNLHQFAWSLVSADGPAPSSEVLSVAYDPQGQRLYVLDVDDHDRIGSLRFARLFRVDLAAGTSTQLLTVPYLGSRYAAISVMEDGRLALVSSGSASHTVWRLDARGSKLKYKGVLIAPGKVRAAPVMGEDRLYLAVEYQPGKLDVAELSPNRFFGTGLCAQL